MPHWLWPLKARTWKGLLPSGKQVLMTSLATDVTQRKGWFRRRNWDKGVWLQQWETSREPLGINQSGWAIPERKDKDSSLLSDSGLVHGTGALLPSHKALLIQDTVSTEGEPRLQPMQQRFFGAWRWCPWFHGQLPQLRRLSSLTSSARRLLRWYCLESSR